MISKTESCSKSRKSTINQESEDENDEKSYSDSDDEIDYQNDSNWVRMRRVNSTKGGFVPLSFLQTTFDKYVIARESYEGGDFELSFNENDLLHVRKKQDIS